MGIKHFRLGGMDFETDDEGMDDIEAIEAVLTETFETGFLDEETGVTYYMSNGSIDIETNLDPDDPPNPKHRKV